MEQNTSSTRTTSFTAEYDSFEAALLAACERLRQLEADVRDYVPKTRAQAIEELKVRQPLDELGFAHVSEQDKADWYELRVEPYLDMGHQIRTLIGTRFIAEHAVIVMMSAALAEALINVSMQYLLAKSGKAHMFPLFDKWAVMEKWEYGPQLALGTYSFSRSSQTYCILKELIAARNAAMHYKGLLEIEGVQHFKSTSMYKRSVREQLPWLKRVANLPYSLHLHLLRHFEWGNEPSIMLGLHEPFPDLALDKDMH